METVDRNCATLDCGVHANFEQESRASASDAIEELGPLDYLDYFGRLQDILKICFDMFIFYVQWFKVVLQGSNAYVRCDLVGLI